MFVDEEQPENVYNIVRFIGLSGGYAYYMDGLGNVHISEIEEVGGIKCFRIVFTDFPVCAVQSGRGLLYTVDFKRYSYSISDAIDDFLSRKRFTFGGKPAWCNYEKETGRVLCCSILGDKVFTFEPDPSVMVTDKEVIEFYFSKKSTPHVNSIGGWIADHLSGCEVGDVFLYFYLDNGSIVFVDKEDGGQVYYYGDAVSWDVLRMYVENDIVFYDLYDLFEPVGVSPIERGDVVADLINLLGRDFYVGEDVAVIDGKKVIGPGGVIVVEKERRVDEKYRGIIECVLYGGCNTPLGLFLSDPSIEMRRLDRWPSLWRIGEVLYWYDPTTGFAYGANGLVVGEGIVKSVSHGEFEIYMEFVCPVFSSILASMDSDIGRDIFGFAGKRPTNMPFEWNVYHGGIVGFVPFFDGFSTVKFLPGGDFKPWEYDYVDDVPSEYLIAPVFKASKNFDVDDVALINNRGESVNYVMRSGEYELIFIIYNRHFQNILMKNSLKSVKIEKVSDNVVVRKNNTSVNLGETKDYVFDFDSIEDVFIAANM